MKIFSQKFVKTLAFGAAATLFIVTSAVQASACTDNCDRQATQAAQTAYGMAYAQQYGICVHMAPGPARDTCFSNVSAAAWGAYAQAYGPAYAACMNSTQCRG